MERHPYCAISGVLVSSNIGVHHIRSVGAGGTDDDFNLERLLPKYHNEAHRIGIKDFTIKYKLIKWKDVLISLGKWTENDEKRFYSNVK